MSIRMPYVIQAMLACLASVSFLAETAYAVNYATAYQSPPGYQLKFYPFYYSADTRTNKDGDAQVSDLGLGRYGIQIGNFYQIGQLQLNAIIPVAKLENRKLNDDDAGLGDMQLRAGWNLPLEWASIMPALMVKVPTGNFDNNHKVNLGDGQTDLVMELYFFKRVQPFSFDAVIKYNVRFRNTHNDITPGNEFTAEGLTTYRLAEKIRIGPAVNFVNGANNKKGGRIVADSGLTRLAVGGELWYGRFDKVKISIAGYRDVLTRNTNEGVTMMSRIAMEF